MRPSSGANVILDAWRFINLGTRDLFARVITFRCDECLRPIRWWNRRVWLGDHERCAHLQCFNGRLFLRALVADEIRRSQLIVADFSPPTATRSQPIANGSADNELRNPAVAVITLEEPVEQLDALQAADRGNLNQSAVMTQISVATIHRYVSWGSFYGIFSAGSLHIVRRARRAFVCFVAESNSAKHRRFAPSAGLLSDREADWVSALKRGILPDDVSGVRGA